MPNSGKERPWLGLCGVSAFSAKSEAAGGPNMPERYISDHKRMGWCPDRWMDR